MNGLPEIRRPGFVIWNSISNQYTAAMENIKKINFSGWLIIVVIVLFIVMMFRGIDGIANEGPNSTGQIYKAIGFGMIMVWVCIFICYFIWAVFYFNVNKGYNSDKRKRVKEAKLNRSKGLPYRLEDIEEAKDNPYKDETFGFPRGTVRGMIAFTLLYGAIALVIVSFGMTDEPSTNNLFASEIDFFKKAFLMMIAFYFGSHSLEYLYPKDSKNNKDQTQIQQQVNSNRIDRQAEEPGKPEIVVIPSKDDLIQKIKVDDMEIPPIQAIDPMSPKK